MMLRRLTSVLGASLASGLLFLAVATPSRAATAAPRSVDEMAAADGLVRVPDSTMAQAWIKPGVDLHAYTGLVLRSTEFRYQDAARHNDYAYPISDEQKRAIEEMIPAEVAEKLSGIDNLKLADAAGANVLVLDIAVVDIVSHVPPEPAGRGATFVRTLGAATLAMELRDSVTGEIVARAIERRHISPNLLHKSNRAWNRIEVRNAAEAFGLNLRKQVEEFTRL
jgi:hypothetical protein